MVLTLGKGLRDNQCYELQGNFGGCTVHLCASEKHRFFLIERTTIRDTTTQFSALCGWERLSTWEQVTQHVPAPA